METGETQSLVWEKTFHFIVCAFNHDLLLCIFIRIPGRVINAWTQTPTTWYPIPIAVGAILLVVIQYRRTRRAHSSPQVDVDQDGVEVIKLKGPWQVCIVLTIVQPTHSVEQVHVLGALPLRNMSRVWGYINSLELPPWFRPFGFRVYAFAFGCNLDEIDEEDLKTYKSLGEFFYRKLKEGARPVDNAVLVCL